MLIPLNVTSTDETYLHRNVSEIGENSNVTEENISTNLPDLEFKDGDNFILTTADGFETIKPYSDWEEYMVPTNSKHDVMYSISIGLKNSGNANASNVTVNILIFYYDDEGIKLNEWNDNYTIGFIEFSDEGIAYFSWAPQRWNTYYLISFNIDPEDEIIESNENNNQLIIPEEFRTNKDSPSTSPRGFSVEFCILSITVAGATIILVGVSAFIVAVVREIEYRSKLK